MVLGKLDSDMQKNESGPLSYINSKGMKDLNLKQETIKILKKNVGSNLFDITHSNFLIHMFPEAREIKAKMNYWDFIRIKTSAQ